MPPDLGLAIHIGADRLTSPRHVRWPVVRSCRDTVERTTRLPPISCGVGTGQIYAAGQQPPLPGSLTFEFGGGQLMAVLVPSRAQAADPAVLTPPAAQAGAPRRDACR